MILIIILAVSTSLLNRKVPLLSSLSWGRMVTQSCVPMTDPTIEPFSLKSSASFESNSSGSFSNSHSGSCSSSDSGEKTLNSDCSSIYVFKGNRRLHNFFTSDEEEEDWSISETATCRVTHFVQKDPPFITTYRLITALDVWLHELRFQTELDSPSTLISKPLTPS